MHVRPGTNKGEPVAFRPGLDSGRKATCGQRRSSRVVSSVGPCVWHGHGPIAKAWVRVEVSLNYVGASCAGAASHVWKCPFFRCAGFRTLVYSTCFMHSNASGGSLAWSTGQKAGQRLSLAVFDDLTRGTAGNAPLSVAASQRTCAPYRAYLPYANTYLASVRAVSLWVSLCFACNATFVDGNPESFCVQHAALRNPRFRD